jgi:hypothetical protein
VARFWAILLRLNRECCSTSAPFTPLPTWRRSPNGCHRTRADTIFATHLLEQQVGIGIEPGSKPWPSSSAATTLSRHPSGSTHSTPRRTNRRSQQAWPSCQRTAVRRPSAQFPALPSPHAIPREGDQRVLKRPRSSILPVEMNDHASLTPHCAIEGPANRRRRTGCCLCRKPCPH